jgi:tetratricopeptide (TPR) repeat protein
MMTEFAKSGIKLSHFRHLIVRFAAGEENLVGLTTAEVCRKYVVPLTGSYGCSVCDFLKLEGHPAYCDIAQVFISHAWMYQILDVLEALEQHFVDTPEISIWFDVFSHNQHAIANDDFHWLSTTFRSAIKQFGYTVIVLAPWGNPIPLTRAWCLFEVWATAEENCRFEVAMSKDQQKAFVDDNCKDNDVVDKMLATIDLKNSHATSETDKKNIFLAVQQSNGFDALNQTVLEKMRAWIIETFANRARDNLGLKTGLAKLYCQQSKFAEAAVLYEECLIYCKTIYGDRNTKTLDAIASFAAVQVALGKFDDAETLLLYCLEIVDYIEAYDRAFILYNLAILYLKKGNPKEAASYSVECFTRRSKSVRYNHKEILEAMVLQADVEGNYEKGERIYLECLEKQKGSLGDSHASTLEIVNKLGGIYSDQGKYEAAEAFYKQCLEKRRIMFGEYHVVTLESLNNLGSCFMKQGAIEKAIEYFRECIKKQKVVLGENNPQTLSTMLNLAKVSKDLNTQEQILLECNEKIKISLPDDHPIKYSCKNALAVVYCHQNRPAIAEPQLKECLRYWKQRVGETHPETLAVINNLAAAYNLLNKTEKVIKMYAKYLPKMKLALGEAHPTVLTVINNIAHLYYGNRQWEESLPWFVECWKKRKSVFGDNHPDTITCLYYMASIHLKQRNFVKAELFFVRVWELRKSVLGVNDPETLMSQEVLGTIYSRQGKYDEAVIIWEDCLEKTTRVFGTNHHQTAKVVNNLQDLREQKKKF